MTQGKGGVEGSLWGKGRGLVDGLVWLDLGESIILCEISRFDLVHFNSQINGDEPKKELSLSIRANLNSQQP